MSRRISDRIRQSAGRIRRAAAVLFAMAGHAAGAGPSQPPATPPRTIHVIVALRDNASQGIVPVPAALGNGDDPARNLYWGARYGVRACRAEPGLAPRRRAGPARFNRCWSGGCFATYANPFGCG